MKKLLIALVLASLFVLGVAVAVSADNGPHGSFTATTDACASCHRAHTAQYGSNSLLIANPEALCMSCHDGTGAGTNVHDGVYSQAGANDYYGTTGTPAVPNKVEGTNGASLFAGGFTNTLMATAWSGAVTANAAFNATSRPVTSEHAIDVSGTVWGSGAANSTAGTMTLECTSCHDPHGTGGYRNATPVVGKENVCDPTVVATNPCTTKWRSYRLLRWQPSGSAGFTAPAGSINWSGGAFPGNGAAGAGTQGWTVPDNFAVSGTEWYTIGTTAAFAVGDYNAGNANNVYNLKNATAAETATYIPAATNTAYFCAQCHDRYFANTRLRNATDASLYCGAPVDVPATATNNVKIPINATAPAGCVPASLTSGGVTYAIWGDNRPTDDTTYMYMHSSGDVLRPSVDGVVAAGAGTSVSRSCVACHVAHGTSAEMTDFASGATLVPAVVNAAGDDNNSTLLRMDNRSVCLRCHATTVNFVVAP